MQKVILVTGASSGLGREIVAKLSLRDIVYAGLRDMNDIKKNKNIEFVKLDITSDSECRAAVEKIINRQGRIDVLINNAAYSISGPTVDFSVLDFQRILDANTIGAFRLIKYVVPYMKRRKSGKIINITSLNGLISLPNFGLYSASKHALEALGVAIHYELDKFGIHVTNLAPGAIYTREKKPLGLQHKPARERIKILNLLMPMVTRGKIAKKVQEIIDSSSPLPEIVIGADAAITTLLKKLLPYSLWDKLMNFIWKKK